MWILLIKILLIVLSTVTFGILPIMACFNMFVWNEIIIKYVITCGQPITSGWIILGLTAIGFSFGSVFTPFSKDIGKYLKK